MIEEGNFAEQREKIIKFCNTQKIDFDSLEDYLVRNRLKDYRERKQLQGKRGCASPRYGDCDKRCTDARHSLRCEKERNVLDMIARWRPKEGKITYHRIAEKLNDMGIKPRNANRWSYFLVWYAFNKEKRMMR